MSPQNKRQLDFTRQRKQAPRERESKQREKKSRDKDNKHWRGGWTPILLSHLILSVEQKGNQGEKFA